MMHDVTDFTSETGGTGGSPAAGPADRGDSSQEITAQGSSQGEWGLPTVAQADGGQCKAPDAGQSKGDDGGQCKAPEPGQSKGDDGGQCKAPEPGQSKRDDGGQCKAPEPGQSKRDDGGQCKAPEPPKPSGQRDVKCIDMGVKPPEFTGPSISAASQDQQIESRAIVRPDPSGIGFTTTIERGTSKELDERQYNANMQASMMMVEGFINVLSGQQDVVDKISSGGRQVQK
ncbi:hypothetical protein [Kitasatospora sp. NPDC058190]|uniref:hypothetical protein n=1 Tax=Kitasatospora sp. NPDC058190 TaxID=3346371 RepID=UPI0036DB58D6